MKKPKRQPTSVELPDDKLQPWHITPMRCLWASAVLIGLTIIALPFDVRLANWIQQNHIRGDLERLINLSEVFGYGLTVVVVVITATQLDLRGWRVAPRLLACAFGAGMLANLCKVAFVARWRPNSSFHPTGNYDSFVTWLPWLWREQLPGNWDRHLMSFPSGHSATAVGLALGLSIFYPKATWWFLILALMAMVQRIESRAHYLSDTLAGAAVACLAVALLLHSAWLERRLRKWETLPSDASEASTAAN